MTLQNVKISLKTDDLSNWTSFNPVLNDGELAIVNDISANLTKFKVGNGLSTFTQLPYVDEKIVTNYLQANDVQAHHFSQGVHAESSPLGLAAGYFLSAAANFSQVMGVNAQAAAGTDYSFVWNGNDIEALGQYYSAHGKGSFNINPLSGISGVYVGEQTLADIIDSNVSSKQDALDDAQMSAVNSGITSVKVQKYDGYEAAIQQKIELSDIPSDLSAFTNSPGYLVSNDISDYYKKSETSSAAEISDAFELSSGNKVFIDDHILSSAGYSDLSVVKLSASEYEALVSTSATISNALYIVEDEFEDAYGQQVKNMAPGTDLSDAVNVEQLSNAINNIQIPTDLSSFTNSPGYLVSNDISSYYKKSETSSASEISSALAEIASLSGIQQIVWADLVGLAQTSALVPGMKYRITDYVTEVDQEDCRSAEHPFDLIVTAIDHHTLDENARATIHEGDDYFAARPFHVPDYQQYLEYARVPLESWEIKYCLDNDKTRFKFADTENGKGVIYYMKDEFGNEAPYDFKNVQFRRYKITSSPGASGLEGTYGLAVGDIEVDTSDKMWCYTFNGADYANFGLSEPYDFSGWYVRPTQAVLQQFGGPSVERLQECAGNVIQARQDDSSDFSLMSFKLPSNVFHCALTDTPVDELPFLKFGQCGGNRLGLNCYDNTFGHSQLYNVLGDFCNSNTFGNSCNSNTFGNDCNINTFGNDCNINTFGNDCDSNTFGNSCNSNTFGNDCNSNTFGNSCNINTFGNSCVGNTFGNSCVGNTFGNDCNINTFGNDCDSNTFGNSCNSNTFGNNCYSNTFGNSCDSNTFGNSCNSNTFGNSCIQIKFASDNTIDPSQAKSYYKFITVDSGNQFILLNCTQSTYSGNEYKNVRILPGVNNTTSYKTITDNNVNQSFCTTYQPANSQVIAI